MFLCQWDVYSNTLNPLLICVRFLLPKLQLKSLLRKKDIRSIPALLNNLPVDHREAYVKVINQLIEKDPDTKDFTFKILSWVFHAARPLTMAELQQAMYVRANDHELEEQWLLPPDQFVEQCEGLLVHDKSGDAIRFVHSSVREFL